ncbi:MAG: hypothetical protein KGL39_35405 [Patescibacteria group bacterium]|nr:hypothetical protein [Patescibacteria group bacterium]
MIPTSPTNNQKLIFVPYFYVAAAASIAASSSAQVPLILDEDADFELHWMTATSSLDAATDFRPNNFSVLITDKNNSRIWASGRVPQVAFVPRYSMARPVVLSRRSNLNFDFLNLSSGSACLPTVVLHGFKVLGLS